MEEKPAPAPVSNDNVPQAEKVNDNKELQKTVTEVSFVDVPPDGGYGWVVVGCCFMVNAMTWGVNSSYGVYLAHYLSSNKYPNATPLQYAFIGGLSVSQSMFIAPIVTLLLRRTSTRTGMAVGIILQTGSLTLASFSTAIWHLFLTQGVLFGWGLGFLFTSSVGTISQWFSKKRSLANGITSAGSGIGGLVFSLSIQRIIQTMGVEWAFRIVAICVFVTNTVCTLLIKDRNKIINPNQKAFDWRLLKRFEFQLVMGWGFLSMLGYIVILFSLPDYAASVGMSKQQGSILTAMLNLGMAFGRPLVGIGSDRYGRINTSGVMTLVSGLSCFFIWIWARSFGVAILFSLVNGAVCGTFWTTISPVTVEVVGIKELPSALSLVWLSVVLPTTFSEPIALYLRRPGEYNAYLYPQIFSGVLYIGAAGCMYALRVWALTKQDQKLQGEDDGERKGSRWWRLAKV